MFVYFLKVFIASMFHVFELISLGVESTADNLGIGIVTGDGEVLANITKIHVPEEGGIHPREAARHHSENIGSIIRNWTSSRSHRDPD